MEDIKLLNTSFNIVDVKHVPTFLAPYTFVISMPHHLTLICPEEETPDETLSEPRHSSCFVIENDNTAGLLADANTLTTLLTGAGIDVQVMNDSHNMYIFVSTDDAMPAVMLLSKDGYDVVYSDLV